MDIKNSIKSIQDTVNQFKIWTSFINLIRKVDFDNTPEVIFMVRFIIRESHDVWFLVTSFFYITGLLYDLYIYWRNPVSFIHTPTQIVCEMVYSQYDYNPIETSFWNILIDYTSQAIKLSSHKIYLYVYDYRCKLCLYFCLFIDNE